MCCSFTQIEEKKKENVLKSKDYEYKMIIQQMQSNHDRNIYNINNRSVKSVSDNRIIERKENLLFIKFSNEEFSSIQL